MGKTLVDIDKWHLYELHKLKLLTFCESFEEYEKYLKQITDEFEI